MGQVLYAQVLLPIRIPQAFTYKIPEELKGKVRFGQRVLVQFGPRRIQSALVWSTHSQKPDQEIKSIIGILDEKPVINNFQKELWEWMADYYLCTLGEIMKAALPAGLKLESHTRILVNHDFESTEAMAEVEELAWLYLLKNPGCSIHDLGSVLKRKNPLPIIHKLVNKGAIFLEEKLINRYKHKTETYIQLADEYQSESDIHALLDKLKRAPKQINCLEAYLSHTEGPNDHTRRAIAQKEFIKDYEISMSGLASLLKKGVFLKSQVNVSRLSGSNQAPEKLKELNSEQAKVLTKLESSEKNSVNLLHGITSSGKTEVYTHLIKSSLDQGKQVLYLLPEIALTEQIINRLRKVFDSKIGVFHSKYSDSERVELWQDMLSESNKYKLILGARSALFLPFSNLDLVIIDEEHETSFKQHDPAPRYHARDAAIVMARIHQARVVLGTATPSLETYYNAKSGKFNLLNLDKRHKDIPLPDIIVANTKEAHRKKRIKGHFTPELLEAIDQALVNKEQIILFQNRRGYSPYVECESCGHIPKCRDCDVSLTLHKYRNQLVCHYCGYAEKTQANCPSCHNSSLRTRGMGTEGLEDEVGIIFPDARIARLDMDTARSRKGYARILGDFEDQKTDILIGTQMVSKGLDFSNVSVVGIINADNMLHFPDFRSFERSFQLMTQVSGRAGRSKDQGLVIIQSFDPSHRVIQQVLQNNYLGLYKIELRERMEFAYPPFTRLIKLTFKHKDIEIVNRCSHVFAKELRTRWTTRILGPQAPGISRVQQYYLRQILIKSAKGTEHRQIREHIRLLIQKMSKEKTFRSVIIQPDVDPV
ncbi:MAG: primosomal protein N' [Bacteroidales bacterium]|nr:primosomal protein N' [Bacteroidales bacterium]